MDSTQLIGWVSSLLLLATISSQVWSQWRSGISEGVSVWLFLGQTAASTGFTIYSVLIRNWVFIVTNGLLVASAVTGLLILRKHRGSLMSQVTHEVS